MVDGIHFVHTIEGLDLQDFFLLNLLATVEDTVHVEVYAHAVGKGLLRVIGGRQ